MRTATALFAFLLTAVAPAAFPAELSFTVSDPDGAAARVAAPLSTEIDSELLPGQGIDGDGRCLLEIGRGADTSAEPAVVPMQIERAGPGSSRAVLWWRMPKGPKGPRRFRLVCKQSDPGPEWRMNSGEQNQFVELAEGDLPVLRYNHGPVPVREGTHPHFAPGESYERGDYIYPLFGPDGEDLTEDYPRDHPHHRGVWWSWPVTRYGDQVADIWAVAGVWSRPVSIRRATVGPVFALIEAENVWKFGKAEEPIVREKVLIRAFRQAERCRFVDVEVRLTALADGVAIGGRPKRGYGGFSLRAAPCQERKIMLHTDPEGAQPRRSWLDYSGLFSGGKGPAGVAIFEHVTNPDYPNPLHEYPACNCVMPAYPADREVLLSKETPLVLKHRLWIHTGGADEDRLADVWTSYAQPPNVTLITE
jgi:hypothetical protein